MWLQIGLKIGKIINNKFYFMDTDYLKAFHIIFVITWFAGLFYIVRLFIYQTEANKKPSPEKEILQNQYKIMSRRLWYMITWPSAILASVFAFWFLFTDLAFYLTQSWMLIKLGFVGLLFIYQLACQKIYSQLQNDIVKIGRASCRERVLRLV